MHCQLPIIMLLGLIATTTTTVAHQSMRRPVEMAIKSLTISSSDSAEVLVGATEECSAALKSDDVAPTCLDELARAPNDNDKLLVDMCTELNHQPDNEAYRCSRAKAEHALNVLEAKCGAELANGHAEAIALYSRWYLYPLAVDVICSKDDDGSLCHYGPPSETMLDANWECLRCIRKEIRIVDHWEPKRVAGPATKAYDRWWFANNDLKHHCGMNG
ncbi:hypothetical protein BDF22DRAFT_205190 [Syncephalis plumigaleata]|nr:hypothetical protein BDF22DRAFT_205190 [Syncephalis plumigaleata]